MTDWKEQDGKLTRQFEFDDFKQAFAFLSKVALAAESQQHHPEIFNVYNTVELKLSTHDADGAITDKDKALAEAINALL